MARLRYIENARTGSAGTICKGTNKLQFFDDDSYIYASEAGVLNVVAGTELVLEATTITLNGAFAFSGTDSLALGTSASPLTLTAGSPLFTLYTTTSNTTSTNAEPFYVKSVVTGIGGYGGRSRFHTYSNVASGTNLMALKAHMEFGDSGYCNSGLAAAFCAELVMPNSTTGGGTYCVLELEYVAGGSSLVTSGGLSGNYATFIRANNSGDANGDFDDLGFLMVLTGLTDATTHVWYDNTLRIGVGTATWYLPMSSAEASYTTAYPIATTSTIASTGAGDVTAISVEGTVKLALGIGATTALTTATTAMSAVKVQSAFSATTGYHVGAWFVGNYTAAGAAGGSVYALRGHAAVTGTQTTVGTAAYIVGVHGRCAVTGTAYNSSAIYAGVLAQMLAGGTWTAANLVYCLWVDNQLATNPTTGTVAMVGIRQNNNSSTAVVDHCFDIYGPKIDNFINFDTCTGSGSFISNSAATGSVKKVKCKIGDTDYYINMYELS